MNHLAVGAIAAAFLVVIIVVVVLGYSILEGLLGEDRLFMLFVAVLFFGLGVAFIDWISERRK